MRIIHVTRKPLTEGSVASNILLYGTGGLNIDSSRVRCAKGTGVWGSSNQTINPDRKFNTSPGMHGYRSQPHLSGRWPSNVLLQHGSSCVYKGMKRIPAKSEHPSFRSGMGYHGGKGTIAESKTVIGDVDGFESIEDWVCGSSCPVSEIEPDRLSGTGFDVSRFYKQFPWGDKNMAAVPQELIDYLYNMIAPTHLEDCLVLHVPDVAAIQWGDIKDASVHGIILHTPEGSDLNPWMDEIWRVLKPGAHVMLISPEDQPTGHTGACTMEDKGFEVRDAILVAQEAGYLHYVPKPAQKERHSGCEALAKKGEPLCILKEELEEDIAEELREALLENQIPEDQIDALFDEETGIPRSKVPEDYKELFEEQAQNQGTSRGNVHPTVKGKDLMKRLLADIPDGATVVDPFTGSGSTGLACLETGHNFIGIEKEPEYIQIAEARIRYWDSQRVGDGAEIVSEAPPVETKREELDLEDFFG